MILEFFIGALFLLFGYLCLYNHFVSLGRGHVSKFPPGPNFLRISPLKNKKIVGPSGIPFFGYLPWLGPVPCETIKKLSRKWGPIFSLKLGQFPVVFLNDYEKTKELFKLDSMTGRAHLELFEKRGVYGLGLLEGEDWKEVRRFFLRCLRDSGFGKSSMESSIQNEVVQAIRLIRKQAGRPLYLKPLIEISVVNSLWQILTGERFDIEDPNNRHLVSIMSESLSEQDIVGICAFLPKIAKCFPNISGYKKAMKYFEAPEALAADVVKRHIANYKCGAEKDFIDHTLTKIYETTESQSMFYKDVGMKNLHYSLIDLFYAGSDTLSSILGWTFLYLSMWPDKQKKVHHEIDSVVEKGKLPSLECRPRMPYTEATIAETMRVACMVPLGLLHKAIDDIQFEQFVFPKGTYFLANLHSIFKDEEHWVDPDTFTPERFLNSEGLFQKNERLIPFFTGKRTCIGESLAMTEYFLFLTGILQSFQFSLNPMESFPKIGPKSGFILSPPKHTLLITERESISE